MGPRCPGFPLKKSNMVLKHFILPEEHFKANLFFSHYDPPESVKKAAKAFYCTLKTTALLTRLKLSKPQPNLNTRLGFTI